eukprot:TRINITY_DN978_c1_g1_i4.p1 TRINITY_DN978_c1_g1~~TRINITY_DN978_c1_g1_i4.p1  ORF type:complete len:432 (+),score=108.82 TRINITY_DN978_c1_g1_i4:88-1296(+)
MDALCEAFRGLATAEAGTMPKAPQQQTAAEGCGRRAGGSGVRSQTLVGASGSRAAPYSAVLQPRGGSTAPKGDAPEDELAALLAGLTVGDRLRPPSSGQSGSESSAGCSDDGSSSSSSSGSGMSRSSSPAPQRLHGGFHGSSYRSCDQQSAPVTPESVYLLMMQAASDRGTWEPEDTGVDECRFLVSLMAQESQRVVSYRICAGAGASRLDSAGRPGAPFVAPFAFVAPAPDARLYGTAGDPAQTTVVYTPRIVPGAVDLHTVVADVECKFLAHWEVQLLLSLKDADPPAYRARLAHTRSYLRSLNRCRVNPAHHPPRLQAPRRTRHAVQGLPAAPFGAAAIQGPGAAPATGPLQLGQLQTAATLGSAVGTSQAEADAAAAEEVTAALSAVLAGGATELAPP